MRDNHPDGARRCMRRFYGLVRASYGEPRDPAEAARLEVDWWRAPWSGPTPPCSPPSTMRDHRGAKATTSRQFRCPGGGPASA